MPQIIFTLILPVNHSELSQLEGQLSSFGYKGPSNEDILCFKQVNTLHYASMFLYDDSDSGYLCFEGNIDAQCESREQGIRDFLALWFKEIKVNAKEKILLDIFSHSQTLKNVSFADLPGKLVQYINYPSTGYSGCVGRSRDQIIFEAKVQKIASQTLDSLEDGTSQADAKSAVIHALDTAQLLEQIATIPTGTPRKEQLLEAQLLSKVHDSPNILGHILTAIKSALAKRHYLHTLKFIAQVLAWAFFMLVSVRLERTAAEENRRQHGATVRKQREYEDHLPTNHMISVVHLHTDFRRKHAKKNALAMLDFLARYAFTNGSLGSIPTIHFAHWATVNEGQRLLFVSNFDGNWDSYLDDFTLKANEGLTLAWSHCVGIPRSWFMVFGGAAKGPEFIDWARNSMVPSLVWYNAYPELSIRNVNSNSALRQAIAENNSNWLELV